VFFEQDSGFVDVDFAVPAEHVRRGENYLLLTFGGATLIDGKEVSVAVDSLRIDAGASVEADGFVPPRYASLTGEVTVGDVARSSVVVRAPTQLSWYAHVPDNAKLGFGVGLEGEGGADVSVTVTPEGESARRVFSSRATNQWSDQVVDLAPFAGKVVRFDFDVTGQTPGRVAWSTPAVLVPPAPAAPPVTHAKNVVVLLIDTLRAEKLRPYNPHSRVQTPIVDRLAQAGTVFERAQSTSNWTKPSVAGILTGLTTETHGARSQEAVLSDDALLLSEHLQANGFETGGFIANGYVSDRFGFDQGWDRYRNFIREGGSSDATNVFGEAGEWVEANKDGRFFLYIQTIDPHVPYDPPDRTLSLYDAHPYDGPVQPRRTHDILVDAKATPPRVNLTERDKERLSALHDGEITQHDEELGKFLERLEALGIRDHTLIVIVSDHGEEFDEHGSWGHGHTVYQELLHVPFIFHHAGGVPATRVPATVSTIDLAPTVAELAGVPPLPAVEGRSLVGLMHGRALRAQPVAFSDWLDERRVATSGRWKLVIRGNLTASMFDLESDPWEENQVEVSTFPVAGRYLRIMHGQYLGARDRTRWLDADQQRSNQLQAGEVQMDDSLREQLEALGYVH
jgi:arylsulfatase A-like enzyme